MAYYKIFTDHSLGKKRNTFVVVSCDFAIIIDPQLSSLDFIKQEYAKLPGVKNILVVLSHEHVSHYDGMPELLYFLEHSEKNPYVSVVAPKDIISKSFSCCSIKNILTEVDRNIVLFGSVFIGPAKGHCGKMITIRVLFQDMVLYFLGDNLTTNFPAPITNGGSPKEFISFYDNLLAKIEKNAIFLPGHGKIKGIDHVLAFVDYYRKLPCQKWDEVSAMLKDFDSEKLGKKFHHLNLSVTAGLKE